MADLGKLVEILTAELGYRERGTNLTKYNEWLGQIPGYPHNGYGYAWCHSFASWGYAKAGLSPGNDFPRTAGCLAGVKWYRDRKRWGSSPRPGAQVYYGPGGGTHTEIVIAVSATHITTIGGNTSGSYGGAYHNGDGVYKKTLARNSSRIYGYGYPRNLEDDDVALSKDDIKAIADAVWNADVIPAPPWKVAEGNANWTPKSYLHWGYRQGADIRGHVMELGARPAAQVDAAAVAAEVLRVLTPAAIASAIPADLAAKVMDELKARL